MSTVVASIIPESFDDLSAEMGMVRGLAERVQIDIANGSYAPMTTWPFNHDEHFTELVNEEDGLPFWRELDAEVDMLILGPEQYLDSWIHVGVSGAVIHIETTESHSQILKNLRMADVEVGWGIKPNTENQKLFDVIAAHGMPDFVQVMGNDRIGYHGVELDERVYTKVSAIRKQFPELTIAVDIGVDEETAPRLVEAGVNKLVAGSAIFGADNVEEAVEYFESLG